MGVNDTAEHDVCVAVGYDLCDLTFEMRFGLGDAKRSHLRRWCRCQMRPAEFVLVAREVSRGEVHSFQQVHRHDIGDKFRHLAEILEAVLNAGRAECDVRRVASHQVKIGVRREVAHSAVRNCRNPAHRPRHHQGSQEGVKAGCSPIVRADFKSGVQHGGRRIARAGHETGSYPWLSDRVTIAVLTPKRPI